MEKNTQWYNSAFLTEEDINIMKNVTEEDNFPVLHFKEYKGKENCFWKVISVATIFVMLFIFLVANKIATGDVSTQSQKIVLKQEGN